MILVALLLLVIPGLALAVQLEHDEGDPLVLLGATLAAGAALWITSFWFLPCLPRSSLTGLGLFLAAAALPALLLSRRRLRALLASLRWGEHRLALLVLAGLTAFRFFPCLVAPVAPGADMSMHSYMARLILEAGGVPSTYQPLLPIREFGAYAAGLPTLGAMLGALSGASAARGAMVAACLSHLLVDLAVYAFVRRRSSPVIALVATLLATIATRDPQHHFEWGGNPTVLSLALVTMGLLQLERLEDRAWARLLVLGPLVFSAAALTHSVIPFALVFALPPTLLYRYRGRWPAWRTILLRGLALAALTVLLMAPYLSRIELSVSPAERAWIMNWQRLPIHLPPGPRWLLPFSLAGYVVVRLGAFFTAWLAVALACRRWLRCPPIGEELIFGAGILLLVLNAYVWILPASYAIYPDRTTILLVPVSARIVAAALEGAAMRWRGRPARITLVCALLASLVPGAILWYVLGLRDMSVSKDDLAAIRWIEENTAPGTLLDGNYGDAGLWIPALAFRPMRSAHVNIVYLDEVSAWRREARPSYVFVGARRVYPQGSPYDRVSLLAQPGRYREVFRQGHASVFRVLD